jgi:cytidyltransferase-like protein
MEENNQNQNTQENTAQNQSQNTAQNTTQNTALWIGRYQTFHNGHINGAKQIEESGIEKLIIGIGSAQEKNTLKNPFTFEERKKMVQLALEDELTIPFEIFAVPDTNTDESWTQYILDNIPKSKKKEQNNLNQKNISWSDYIIENKNIDVGFDTVYSGNPHVKNCFKNYNVQSLDENRVPLSAGTIRQKIGTNENINNEVPQKVINYLQEINARDRLKILMPKPRNPFPTADGIVKYNGKIVLIERENTPFGWALPGGFMEYGDSGEQTAIKEVKEETGLEFKVEKFLGEYSRPDRDPRQHNLSLVYIGNGTGKLEAQDDAKDSMLVTPYQAIRMDLAFDHKEIIVDYINSSLKTKLQYQKDKLVSTLGNF